MIVIRKLLLTWVLAVFLLYVSGQRTYVSHSVLASGNWYRMAVTGPAVYKIDLPFLGKLGITGNIPSSQVRIFGNGGSMVPEDNSLPRPDDLIENSIYVSDGGDGILNGSDFILFFARGPHHWRTDSFQRSFTHVTNIYSDSSFYFLTIGGQGLRIIDQLPQAPGAVDVLSFDEHFYHELDTVSLLASGKEWLGETFSSSPGYSLSRSFTLPFSDVLSQQAVLKTQVAARSANTPSRFQLSYNSQPIQTLDVDPVGTSLYDVFAKSSDKSSAFIPSPGAGTIAVSYTPGSFNSQGWLNWFEFFARRNLTLPVAGTLLFRDWNSVGNTSANFRMNGANSESQVWDVSDPLHPVRMRTTIAGQVLSFTNDALRLLEYAAFSSGLSSPIALGKVANQDLHNTSPADLLIITYPAFMNEARRLETLHRDSLRVQVVTTEQVYNEFSGGLPDPAAIRDFVKMYYDRYRSDWSHKYLLLLGRASYDYKNRIAANTNFVPAWESDNSLDPLSSYTSDDFFGFLDDNENINQSALINLLDLGIGRIPARTAEEAKNFVDKVIAYKDPKSLGPWRNQINFIADDEDQNLHLDDAESLSATVSATAPVFNQQKIYLDAFPQESGSAGGRYPLANAAVNNNILNGTLIWNYTGHGGAPRLAEEVILDQTIADSWRNGNRLPLFVTATCDFVPFDNPAQHSLGEYLLMRPVTGAIALMSTTRVVFAFSNRIINNNYLRLATQKDVNGKYRSLGQAMMDSKNETYRTSTDIVNNRKFTLIGDPALTLSFPVNKVVVDRVNGKNINAGADTLRAAQGAEVEGYVADASGAPITSFQGTAYLSFYDKVQAAKTLGNDPTSIPTTYPDQENIVFRGKVTVKDGRFVFRFKMPRDINYQFGPGKLSLYADDGKTDGNGYSTDITIGGISAGADPDKKGPDIKAWLNDEAFVNGSITNATPVLVLRLSDSSGINTASSGLGHDIVATLDNDNNKYYILNNLYETDKDDYQHGGLRFQLPQMEAGTHTIRIKAWDVLNNSNEYVLDFTVVNQDKLKLDHVLNYPNPFTTRTNFWFEHNFPGQNLDLRIEIFTVNGRIIKTLSQTINTDGNRSSEVEWDGRDDFGSKVARGVYLYRLRVRAPGGKTAEKWERLVIL